MVVEGVAFAVSWVVQHSPTLLQQRGPHNNYSLPGDDQLIPYGSNTTNAIARQLVEESSTIVTSHAVSSGTAQSGMMSSGGHVQGCALVSRKLKTYRYTINNHSSRSVPRLYIDHTASAKDGGYSIKDASAPAGCEQVSSSPTPKQGDLRPSIIKKTTAFARYAVALLPHEEISFEVVEEAFCTDKLTECFRLQAFLRSKNCEQLVQDGVLALALVRKIKNVVHMAQQKTILRKLETGDYDEDDLRRCVAREDQGVEVFGGAEVSEEGGEKLPPVPDRVEQVFIPKTLFAQAERLILLRAQIRTAQAQKATSETAVENLFVDQDRLRKNLQALDLEKIVGKNGEKNFAAGNLVGRYMDDLNRMEDRLGELRAEVAEWERKTAELESEKKKVVAEVRTQAEGLRRTLEANERSVGGA